MVDVLRYVAAVPSAQAVFGPEPHASVGGRHHGPDGRTRQTLPPEITGDGKLAKPVQAASGGNPHTAFTILKDGNNCIAREVVRRLELICPSIDRARGKGHVLKFRSTSCRRDRGAW